MTAVGGAERRFLETLRLFKARGLEFTVLESSPSVLIPSRLKVNVVTVPAHLRSGGWLPTYLGWAAWMVRSIFKTVPLARRSKPDLVLVPNNTLPNLVTGLVAGAVSNRPTCVVVHHVDHCPSQDAKQDGSIYHAYRRAEYGRAVSLIKTVSSYATFPLLNRARAIITVSNFTAHVLRASGVSKPELLVSGNAVRLDAAGQEPVVPGGERYDAVFVGRISREKGIFDLLDVWKEVLKAKKDARLLVVGSGLELKLASARIAGMGLEGRVFLRGRCDKATLCRLLKSSRLFVFPSLFEGWGMAVAEALACGLPVVAYEIPALREVFGACESVFTVPVKNLAALTAAVLDVLGLDEEQLQRLRRCSVAYSQRFVWEDVAQKDLTMLKAMLGIV